MVLTGATTPLATNGSGGMGFREEPVLDWLRILVVAEGDWRSGS